MIKQAIILTIGIINKPRELQTPISELKPPHEESFVLELTTIPSSSHNLRQRHLS